jgi:flagellar hook assembly protein FlgD
MKFKSGATAPASQLSYVVVSYGGGGVNQVSVWVETGGLVLDHVTVERSLQRGVGAWPSTAGQPAANLTINDSTIRTNGHWGLQVWGGSTAAVRRSHFADNAREAIYIDGGSRFTELGEVTFSNNQAGAGNFILHDGRSMTVSQTWWAAAPWVINYDLWVNAGVTWTVEPGATIRLKDNMAIEATGRMLANGTAANPITITSSRAVPAPGSWAWMKFKSGAGSLSHELSYVTVAYGGGQANQTAVWVESGHVAMSSVAVERSLKRGVVAWPATASLTMTDSAIRNSGTWGLEITGGATAAVRRCEFRDNAQHGVVLGTESRFTDLGELTFVNNQGGAADGILSVSTSLTSSQTWPPAASWTVRDGFTVQPGVTWTVEPGTAIKIATGKLVDVRGTLMAQGTASNPITFASTNPASTAANWASIRFIGSAASGSRVSFANFTGGGYSGYAEVTVSSSAPVFDHLVLSNSTGPGLTAEAGATPRVYSSSFLGPTNGGIWSTGGSLVEARLNYWGAADGPSGAGSGTGRAVSGATVNFEPFLVAAAVPAHEFVSASVTNRTFNPAATIPHEVEFATGAAADWQLVYFNGTGTPVRTFVGQGSPATVSWDGRDDGGALQPTGTYSYRIDSTIPGGSQATQARGFAVVDNALQLGISNTVLTGSPFSPNGDGVSETVSYTGRFNLQDVSWTVTVKNAAQTSVRAYSGLGSSYAVTWDGRNAAGSVVADGAYSLVVNASAGTAVAATQATAHLDTTPPMVAITAPTETLLSNVYRSGSADVPILGTVSDPFFSSWGVEYGAGTAPTSWTTLNWGTWLPTNAQLAVWTTLPLTNGTFTLRLNAVDRAGNTGRTTRTVSIGNFSVSQDVLQINPSAGQSIRYTSTVPFALTETLLVKNASGEIVRTLVTAAARTAGSPVDVWDGRSDAGTVQPDGPCFYVATVTAGSYSMTWDLSQTYRNDWVSWNDWLVLSSFDPFNNQPLRFTYDFAQPGRIWIAFSPYRPVPAHCDAPNFCLLMDSYEESGVHTIEWAGVDDLGRFRPDVASVGIVSGRSRFSQNAVVLFGMKPGVGNVRVNPPVFGPAVGQLAVTFDLGAPQGQAVDIQVKFMNQESLSVLRTLSLPGQSAGAKSVTWDGRAENGMWVAPGAYTVTVEAVDAKGNRAKGQILTQVVY